MMIIILDDVEYVRDYGDSNLDYPIGSFKEKTILLAFLSSKLVKVVKSLSYVIDCDVDMKFEPAAYYNKNEILEETKWDNVIVRNDAKFHLSLIFQGKFDPNLVSQYDTNFYYPSSAGKDIDIYILDESLNIENQDEFPKTNERIVENKFNIIRSRAVYGGYNPEYGIPKKSHGATVAMVAGGLTTGVANKANIHGIHLDDYATSNLFSVLLNLINDPLFKPNKSVFNMSFGGYNPINYRTKPSVQLFQEIVNYLSNEGSIFVAAAGNDKTPEKNQDEFQNTNERIVENKFSIIKGQAVYGIEKDDPSNVFLNNGKRVVYSKDNIYNRCGIHAGNKGCPSNQCCSIDGKYNNKNRDIC
ncbi:hypothetical protein BCR32DRAFT_308435 [Anaeromyces robustus]|uniref:Peptidase S8/S53 domain-containing protein n=1 Tax=Anaeromyces robustus TaxID=1754192 RepID=A0A1Y1XBZ6_9FUNG|nr:hypothetical protein BCR32DRAFT_308435 [Anaeromyces robustus]|eukprot:ORX83269.1 hypothetical protein BCR32DRAFT_308435 [Anaeromyces robustus]